MDIKRKHTSGGSPIPNDLIGLSIVGEQPPSQRGRRYTSSPIPPDPSENDTNNSWRSITQKPRIKSEALSIARHHQGEALAKLFNPKYNMIPIDGKPGNAETKNFSKENYFKMKQIQRESRRKQQEKQHQEPVKAVYKPGKFDHISSKVTQELQKPQSASDSRRPASANYLRAHSISGPSVDIKNRPGSAPPPEIRTEKLTIPTTAECKDRLPRSQLKPKNHIKTNIQKSTGSKLRRSPSLSALDDLKQKHEENLKKHKRGAIPQYLSKRREEWQKAEEDRIANTPDPTIPHGHTLMPEKEKTETLDKLKTSQSTMLTELRGLPLSKDTVRVKQRKELLERKLKEVELALKVFSRPKVYVKED